MDNNQENKKSDAALREERILEFWKTNKIFEKSLEKNSPKGNYVFYDGPPFATGQIHYGHILGSTAKDVIGRYQTMQGYHVPRKWGWDCHGLPIENIVEKELGIAGHKEIEKFGIDKFVEHARSKVLQYDKDWEKGIERIGRWVDFRGGYKTMDNTFIESVWWALAELNKKNLVYEGVRVLAYCARCETPIANSEIAMDNSYKDIPDISVYVKFELEDETGTYLLAWTTTPWTIPGNTALAVNKNIVYVKIKVDNDILILAKETIPNVLKDRKYELMGEIKTEDIVGKKYKPVFPYYKNSEIARNENIWKIWAADFVTIEKGTGIAQEAPAFGEDDMILAKAHNIPWISHVDETGRFKSEVSDFAGMQVKPKGPERDSHQKADIEIVKYLAKNNTLFAKEKIVHSYPHCMRCDTPIIYYALSSWFINITEVKKNILRQAEDINWIPSHLKEGRFKNIAENAPDWNISRNRYWASPLPIWKCESCKDKVFINSLADLKNKTKKSGNKYFVMRHGESEKNVLDIISCKVNDGIKLTEKGEKEVRDAVMSIKSKIDLIVSSELLRTQQTAKIAEEVTGVKEIITDSRLNEYNHGVFDKHSYTEWLKKFSTLRDVFEKGPEQGESIIDLEKRVGNILYEFENKYKNKNILFISHGGPAAVMLGVSEGALKEEMIEIIDHHEPKPAEIHELDFVPLPHNENYELDLHRPYIDDVPLVCECDGDLVRIPEVLDCWFESGSMPFAQDHFPFENKEWQKNNFPAGFVAEYVGQVRTWFYYTHVVSAMLFNKAPFKNIVTTGTLRAEDGEKMSKSRNNYPDPWSFIDKYGVDALRIYLMSSTLMKGEDTNFSEKAVQDIASKLIGRLFNVLAFYELYPAPEQARCGASRDLLGSKHVLDQWILARLHQTLDEVTVGMQKYEMAEATRPFDLFIEDLSTWYLRRSRERIKDGDKEAKQTLYYVLKTLAKLIAPFAPFSAEDIWGRLRNESDVESVHLAEWPTKPFKLFSFGKPEVLEKMEQVRKVASLGLERRQYKKIPVRQPLAKIEIRDYGLSDIYIELIKDELNIKEVIITKRVDDNILLFTQITPELKAEGEYREFMRELMDERKKLGLKPGEKMPMTIATIYKKYRIMPTLQEHMLRVAAVASLICDSIDVPVDRKSIISACLLHDMGNIIKFRMGVLPEFYEPEGLEYWQEVKNEFSKKYGENEHEATLKIIKEGLGLPERITNLVDQVRFGFTCKHRDGDDFNMKIVHYADGRVDPHGVVSYEERMNEGKKRYKGHKSTFGAMEEGEREKLVQCGKEIERQIFAQCKIKPEDINDEAVAPIISELKNFMVK